MKYIYILLLLLPFTLSAQNEKPLGYIGITHGASFPLLQYASKDFNNGTFAKTGKTTSIDYAHYISHWGWAATVGGGNHPIDKNAFQQQLNANGINAHPNDSSQWMTSFLMAGPTYGKVYKKFTFEGSILTGFLFGKTPSMTVNERSTLNESSYKYYNYLWECVGGIGIQTRGKISYQFAKHWQAAAMATLYGGNLKFKTTQEAVPEKSQPKVIHEYKIPVSVFNATLGIYYTFTKNKN